ncbi:hypothetical protein HOP50_01g00520 [Chloropicon primus]|uniref:Uncharacterized protein n=1 Tax=Chloropicon primus TaxID=1764295 RepID=A0A5B8MB27_9CHLO|nr:hypothetical protein A3770_01p00610 [Chloropicon primus]UPQ96761.1 hypothetical protein HOP50_01g00520 [Chloropicon primus]|eukprot:QDZ17543.1 hypothetical protein A3770_01p00610 [Chloropicon primus]
MAERGTSGPHSWVRYQRGPVGSTPSNNRGSSKIATAQSKIRHLMCELNELNEVLNASSGASTPVGPRQTKEAIAQNPASDGKKNRISPVLLSRNLNVIQSALRRNTGAKPILRTPPVTGPKAFSPPGSGGSASHSSGGGGSSAASTPLRPHSSPDYLGLRREKALAEAEVEKLRAEKDFLRKQFKLQKLDKDEALASYRELKARNEEANCLNDRLRSACQAGEKKCKALSNRLSVSERSFNLMKDKYKQVNKEAIDLTFSLENLKQDYAYTYQAVDNGTVSVLVAAQETIKSYAEREKDLVRVAEESQDAMEDLELQIVLLSEVLKVNMGEKGAELAILREQNKKLEEENERLRAEAEASAGTSDLQQRVSDLERQLESKNDELGRLEDNIQTKVRLLTECFEEKRDQIQKEVAYTSNHNAKLVAELKAKDKEIKDLKAKLSKRWNR